MLVDRDGILGRDGVKLCSTLCQIKLITGVVMIAPFDIFRVDAPEGAGLTPKAIWHIVKGAAKTYRHQQSRSA